MRRERRSCSLSSACRCRRSKARGAGLSHQGRPAENLPQYDNIRRRLKDDLGEFSDTTAPLWGVYDTPSLLKAIVVLQRAESSSPKPFS